jgi:hypothetical protein
MEQHQEHIIKLNWYINSLHYYLEREQSLERTLKTYEEIISTYRSIVFHVKKQIEIKDSML